MNTSKLTDLWTHQNSQRTDLWTHQNSQRTNRFMNTSKLTEHEQIYEHIKTHSAQIYEHIKTHSTQIYEHIKTHSELTDLWTHQNPQHTDLWTHQKESHGLSGQCKNSFLLFPNTNQQLMQGTVPQLQCHSRQKELHTSPIFFGVTSFIWIFHQQDPRIFHQQDLNISPTRPLNISPNFTSKFTKHFTNKISEYFTNKITTRRNSFPPTNPTVGMDKTRIHTSHWTVYFGNPPKDCPQIMRSWSHSHKTAVWKPRCSPPNNHQHHQHFTGFWSCTTRLQNCYYQTCA